jgi:uncharacterized membrane protein YeaQ/YmgE (transglycosylase-associated protein family)
VHLHGQAPSSPARVSYLEYAMNIMIWLIAGGLIGWAGLHFLSMNRDRGPIPAVLICAAAGFIGGNSVAPMLSSAVTEPVVGFSPFALVVAMAIATAAMYVSSELSRRYDI